MKFNSIQLLRGIAALYVFLYHTKNWWHIEPDTYVQDIIHKGASGVDIFFVISGFVISISLARYKNIQGLFKFFLGRLIRIYPTYWVIASVFLFFPACNENYTDLFLVKGYFLIPSYVFSCTISSWTLCYELYFYFLASWLILSKRLVYLFYLLALISIISIFRLNELLYFQIPEKAIWSLYLMEFFLGMVAFKTYKQVKTPAGVLLVISGLLMHLFIPFTWSFYKVFQVTIPSFLIVLGLAAVESKKKIRIPSVFVMIGNSSYILYLINFGMCNLILNLLIPVKNLHNFIICLFMVAVTAFSVFLHYYFERPMLRHLRNLLIPRNNEIIKKV